MSRVVRNERCHPCPWYRCALDSYVASACSARGFELVAAMDNLIIADIFFVNAELGIAMGAGHFDEIIIVENPHDILLFVTMISLKNRMARYSSICQYLLL